MERRESLDDYREVAEQFNEMGEACRDAGLQFGYHNHDFEFETMEGTTPMDIILEETDPELVVIEMDIYWWIDGGADPLAYIERYPGRFPLCHVKDRTADGEMVDVGDGAIDFAAIFERSDEAGLEHYFVEHDEPEDPMETVQRSYEYLREL